ncbi:hypothetical protein Tco_0389240 [Tanacetum coccineum]
MRFLFGESTDCSSTEIACLRRAVKSLEKKEVKNFRAQEASQLPHAKDKGKAIMVEPKKYLKKKDQIALDEEVARNLGAQLQAELEEETLARQKERRSHHSLN